MSNVFSATVRFGQDAELKTTQGGTDVLQVRAAFDSGWGDNKHTSWVTLVTFGKRATGLAPHIKKGGQAAVWGELKVREYNKQDGSKGESLLPNSSPTFEWIRLAQRIPVRIQLTDVPEEIKLRVGTTCSVLVMTGTAGQELGGKVAAAPSILQ